MKAFSLFRALSGAVLALALGLGLHGGAWAAQSITVSTTVAHSVCGNGDATDNGNLPCSNSPVGNTVTIQSAGVVQGDVTGAYSETAATAVTGNQVNLDGSSTAAVVSGGWNALLGSGDATASGNGVTVSSTGSVPSGIEGGYAYTSSGSATASGNTVEINGGAINGDIYGGYAISGNGDATASNNTVTILGSPVFTYVSLSGGISHGTGVGTISSNNTLNLHVAGLSVTTLDGFQNMNFFLPAGLTSGSRMLTVTNWANMGGAMVTVSLEGAGPTLHTGDTFFLLNNWTVGSINPASASGTVGGFNYTLGIDPALDLVLTIGAPVPATPITAAAVTGITAPATGGTPATAATVPGGSHFTAGAVTWSPTGSPFAASTVYTATVTLTADTGYTFTGLANATINGNPASTINVSAGGDTVTLTYTFPATGPAPATSITAAAVTGITAPVTGSTPATAATVPGGSHFTAGAVTWSPTGSPFAASTVYTATVTLTADTGYTFTGLANATINGNPASSMSVSAAGDTVTLTYIFPATGPAPATAITAAAVTGITAPATGGTPATAATVPGGSHFTAGAVTWSPTGSPFAPATVYTATVTLTADTGYTFTGLANATINGNPASSMSVSAAGDTVTLTYAFPATATAAITAADVTITAPVDGVAPSGTATLASGSHFTAGPVTWSPTDDPFVAGTTYTASVTLTADTGYTFTGLLPASARLNGAVATSATVSAAGDTVELTYTFAPLSPRGTGGGDAASVPTLGQWPLALLALLLGGMGFGAMRRKS